MLIHVYAGLNTIEESRSFDDITVSLTDRPHYRVSHQSAEENMFCLLSRFCFEVGFFMLCKNISLKDIPGLLQFVVFVMISITYDNSVLPKAIAEIWEHSNIATMKSSYMRII